MTISLATAILQNTLGNSEAFPKDVPESYSWYGGWDGLATELAPPGVTAVTGYGVVYQRDGVIDATAPGLVEVANSQTYVRRRSNKTWVLVQGQNQIDGGHFVGDFTDNEATALDLNKLPSGVWTMDPPPVTYNNHWWPNPRGTFADGEIDGCFTYFEIRITDPAAVGRLVCMAGTDWWKNADADYVEPVGTNNPAAGGSNWVALTTTFRPVCNYSFIDAAVFSESLPPPVTGTAGPDQGDQPLPAPPAPVNPNPTPTSRPEAAPTIGGIGGDTLFYVAMVDESETTFGTAHAREDLQVVSGSIDHTEGQKPVLTLEIRNPRVGLLKPGRKRWIWLSWYNSTLDAIEPLFFGRIVAVPANMLGEKITVQYIADPPDFLDQQQDLAEALKNRPNYDPLFLDVAYRDDPNSILEGYSRYWHVSRLALGATNRVTTSDFIFGEDGTVTFEQEEVPYSSVQMSVTQAPATLISMEIATAWQQKFTGEIDIGARDFSSYAGDGIIADWPKPMTQLQGGYSVAAATVTDSRGVAGATSHNYTYNWQNQDKEHNDGDTMSVSVSQTVPAVSNFHLLAHIVDYKSQSGVSDPFAVDGDGDPAPINIPQHTEITYAYMPAWSVATTLRLRYDADRNRNERLRFIMQSDLQEITTSVDAATNFDTIKLTAANVDLPLLDVVEWGVIAGTAVALGTIIVVPVSVDPLVLFANYQIATVAGTAGVVQPNFSDLVGVDTVDGTVTWTAMGLSPLQNTPDWTASDSIPRGMVIRPRTPFFVTYSQLFSTFPVTSGVSISLGTIIRTNDGASYQICTFAGVTGTDPNFNSFSTSYGADTADNTVTWECLGAAAPNGTTYWISTGADNALTGTLLPQFGSGPVGTVVVDNAVTWTSLGDNGNYIGVPIGDVARRSYFTTERGHWSIEYALCVARAHLLKRSRVVTVQWDFRAERFTELSCRKNARVLDPRLPGGTALGKITQYGMTFSGAGGIRGHVTVQCAIGKSTVISTAAGTSDYAASDYADTDWQEHIGAVVAVASGDIGYSPPLDVPNDDGIVFPVSKSDVVLVETVHGSLAEQGAAALSAMSSISKSQQASIFSGGLFTGSGGFFGGDGVQFGQISPKQTTVASALQREPIWYDLQLRPLTGSTFTNLYEVTVTDLVVPKMIDLEAT